MNNLSKILIIIVCFFAVHIFAFAQSKLQKLAINPLNRAVFYFDKLPYMQSNLSPDKSRVVILIPNASAADNSKNATGTGIISDISVLQKSTNLEIIVSLREKRGYTALKLPYSNSVLIEVFKWDNLTQDEDFYRSALLALENDILNEAKVNFEKAATLKNVNASAMLGIIQFSESNIDASLENLLFAHKNKTNIADAYAVLSLIYRQKGDALLSAEFDKKFKEMTGLKSYNSLANFNADSTNMDSEPFSLLSQLSVSDDSLAIPKDTVKTDTHKADSLKVAQLKKDKESEIDFAFMKNLDTASIIKVVMYILAAFSIAYLISYIVKRLKQVSSQKNDKQLNFKRALKRATKSDDDDEEEYEIPKDDKKTTLNNKIKRQKPAANPPKKSGKFVEAKPELPKVEIAQPDYTNNINSLVSHLKETYHLDPDTLKAPSISPTPNVNEVNSSKQVEDFLNQYLSTIKKDEFKEIPKRNIEKAKSQAKAKPKTKAKVVDENSIEGIERKADAKVELALNLARKERQMKQSSLETLKGKDIPDDEKKLIEFAARLGIETNSLETRKNIEELEKDESNLSKLAEKFKINKDKSE